MKNLPALTILACVSISLASSPTIADRKQAIVDVPTKSRLTCEEAIANVKEDLTQRGFFKPYRYGSQPLLQPQVRFKNDTIQRAYSGYPPNRFDEVSFDTVGAKDLSNSPKLMATLAAQIMANCDRIGIVTFNLGFQDWQPIGYFQGNTARTFIEGAEPKRIRRVDGTFETIPLQWGYYWIP